MAHPDGLLLRQAGEQRAAVGAQVGLAELGHARALDAAAEVLGHQLHAVADAERRNAELVQAGSTCGASSAYTEAGPPERTIAAGRRARAAAAVIRWPTSSE